MDYSDSGKVINKEKHNYRVYIAIYILYNGLEVPYEYHIKAQNFSGIWLKENLI